ncbi:MAG: oligosaccharide flippase family protein [Microscillaceae bacterium]|nr:oligosaccharide flippase family protein [Microscillaceae bacterium]MDW8461959.1 oligosaccharide flippase family protein [Cytophagales bacterium]
MGIVIRQSLKGTVVIYVAVVVGTVNNIWVMPKYLPPEYIGVVRALVEYAFLFAAFAHLGIPFIANKFFSEFRQENLQHRGFFAYMLLYPLLGLGLCLGLYVLLKDWITGFYELKSPILVNYYYFVIPLTIFLTYQVVLETYSHLHLRIVVPNILRELLVKIGNLVMVLGFGWGFYQLTGLVWATVVLYALPVIFLFFYLAWLQRLYLKPQWQYFSWEKTKTMGIYGLYTILGGIGVVIVSKVDAIMIPSLLGEKMMGIFTIPYFISLVIEVPKKALKQISTPILAHALHTQDRVLMYNIYQKTSLHLFLVGSFIFLGIWLNIDDVLGIIPNEIYKQGKYVVLFLGLAKVIDMATGLNGELLLFSSHYRFVLVLTIFLGIITIVSNYFFISFYGLNGAGLANLTCIVAYELIKSVYVWYYFKIHPFTYQTLYVLGVSLFVFTLVSFMPLPLQGIVAIFMRSVLISLLFVGLTILLHISPEVNMQLSKIFSFFSKK